MDIDVNSTSDRSKSRVFYFYVVKASPQTQLLCILPITIILSIEDSRETRNNVESATLSLISTMGENELKADGGEVAIPLAPGQPVVVYDPLKEPRYGWVVCVAMHLINGFTWGIIAVCLSPKFVFDEI